MKKWDEAAAAMRRAGGRSDDSRDSISRTQRKMPSVYTEGGRRGRSAPKSLPQPSAPNDEGGDKGDGAEDDEKKKKRKRTKSFGCRSRNSRNNLIANLGRGSNSSSQGSGKGRGKGKQTLAAEAAAAAAAATKFVEPVVVEIDINEETDDENELSDRTKRSLPSAPSVEPAVFDPSRELVTTDPPISTSYPFGGGPPPPPPARVGYVKKVDGGNGKGKVDGGNAPHPIKVGIIGGGLAGLKAAAVLRSLDTAHSLQIVILEARDRIGGRVLTHRLLTANPDPDPDPELDDNDNDNDKSAIRANVELGCSFVQGGDNMLMDLVEQSGLTVVDPCTHKQHQTEEVTAVDEVPTLPFMVGPKGSKVENAKNVRMFKTFESILDSASSSQLGGSLGERIAQAEKEFTGGDLLSASLSRIDNSTYNVYKADLEQSFGATLTKVSSLPPPPPSSSPLLLVREGLSTLVANLSTSGKANQTIFNFVVRTITHSNSNSNSNR